MSLKSLIVDPRTGKQAFVEENALVVATRPLKSFYNKIEFFTNPIYGYNMNVVGGFSGTPEPIHNGIDNVYWTASAISGTWVFDSVTQAHSGTRSVDATATMNDDIAQFAKGVSIDLTGYVAITGWVYLSFWDDKVVKKIEVWGWDTAASLMVGSVVDLWNYVDIRLIGSWQKFTIPLSAMSLVGETIDALRFKTVDLGAGQPPNYYLDDVQFEELGNLVEFSVKPDLGTWLHVHSLSMLFVDAYSTTLADATMPYLSYDKLLGLSSLVNGLLYQGIMGGQVRLTFPFRNLGDFLSFPGFRISNFGSDGTNTFLSLFIDLVEPVVLQSEFEDRLFFTAADDLSGLLKLTISAACKAEVRG